MAGNPFWTYWYFHVPNYLLAIVMYTLAGRFVLAFLFPPDSPNYIWRAFRRITDWAVAALGCITPRYIQPLFLPIVGVFWMFVIRHAYYVVLARAALVPTGAP